MLCPWEPAYISDTVINEIKPMQAIVIIMRFIINSFLEMVKKSKVIAF
jgi:hypothetical protein|tara:strand:+ start:211 stop:354 length:144 start_codon:yes stop_codon:yes gene_type:complete